MIVCHCRGLTEAEIRKVVRDGARTRRAVAGACGASDGCGGCTEAVRSIIAEETASSETPLGTELDLGQLGAAAS